MKFNEDSLKDKSQIWKPSDAYVNWCQIIVGNPNYLEKLYTNSKTNASDGRKKSDCNEDRRASQTNRKRCPCSMVDVALPDQFKTKGPCSLEELNQWQRLIDLMDLKKKCSELQRRLNCETFYKCRVAMTQDCKKQVFDCPCVPRNASSYVKGPGGADALGAGTGTGRGRGNMDNDKGKRKKGKYDDDDTNNKKKGKGGKEKDDMMKSGRGKGRTGKGKGKTGDGKDSKGGYKDKGDGKRTRGLSTAGPECIEYVHSLSDKKEADKNALKKFYTFQCQPVCFEGTYFKTREFLEKYYYADGRVAAKFNCDGTGELYYPNGEVAITMSKGKLGCRFTVRSKSGHDEFGEYFTPSPIAIFDNKGNGVVYDKNGKIRMNYDQAEGILYDTPSKVPVRWQWELHKFVMSRREQLQGVTEDPEDDDLDMDNEELVVAGSRQRTKPINSLKKRKTKTNAAKIGNKAQEHEVSGVSSECQVTHHRSTKPPHSQQIDDWTVLDAAKIHETAIEQRTIAMKLNDFLSLRIQKQNHIHLDFRPFPLHFRFNLGVKVNPEVIERIDKVTIIPEENSEVPCYFELLHTRTKSLRNLHTHLEKLRNDYKAEQKINFIKKAKLMGVLKYIKRMAMKTLNKEDKKFSKMFSSCP